MRVNNAIFAEDPAFIRAGAHLGRPVEDGDIKLTPFQDTRGRAARAGRHTNRGYSGRVVIWIQIDGRLRRFRNDELYNDRICNYAAQQDKTACAQAVIEWLNNYLIGRDVVEFTPEGRTQIACRLQ